MAYRYFAAYHGTAFVPDEFLCGTGLLIEQRPLLEARVSFIRSGANTDKPSPSPPKQAKGKQCLLLLWKSIKPVQTVRKVQYDNRIVFMAHRRVRGWYGRSGKGEPAFRNRKFSRFRTWLFPASGVNVMVKSWTPFTARNQAAYRPVRIGLTDSKDTT